MAITKLKPAGKPLPVQSMARAFQILGTIAGDSDGISHADLSKAVGLHASTAFHLIRTMLALGYLRQDRDTNRYHIGRLELKEYAPRTIARDFSARGVAAIGISGPTWCIRPEDIARPGRTAASAANRLSADLRYRVRPQARSVKKRCDFIAS